MCLGKSDKINFQTYRADVFFVLRDRGTASLRSKYSADSLFYFFAIDGDSFKPILNQAGVKSMIVGPYGVFMDDIRCDNDSIKITYSGPLTGEYNIYCDPSNGQIVRAEGADEEAAVDELAALVESNFAE